MKDRTRATRRSGLQRRSWIRRHRRAFVALRRHEASCGTCTQRKAEAVEVNRLDPSQAIGWRPCEAALAIQETFPRMGVCPECHSTGLWVETYRGEDGMARLRYHDDPRTGLGCSGSAGKPLVG